MARKTKLTLPDAHASQGWIKSYEGRSENPMDWLYDNPLGPYPDFTYGVLKQSYRGFPNTPSEFILRKLRPVESEEHGQKLDPGTFTAYRYGCVLPEDAPDCIDDAPTFIRAMDLAVCEHQPATLIAVTLRFPEARRLHHAWEESRAFCFDNLATGRQLPVLVVQHRPGDAGSDNPVHTHLLISARRVDGTGYRGFATDLLAEEGQRILFEEWKSFREGWKMR